MIDSVKVFGSAFEIRSQSGCVSETTFVIGYLSTTEMQTVTEFVTETGTVWGSVSEID